MAQDLQKLRKKKQEKRHTGYNVTGTDEESTGPVDELFKFIGCDPNKAVVNIYFQFSLIGKRDNCKREMIMQ